MLPVLFSGGGTPGPVYAAVEDNLETAVIEQRIGSYENDESTHTLFGLLWRILSRIGSVEQNLTDKIDETEAVLQTSIKQAGENAHAGQSLYVYLPVADALADYEETQITLLSPSGNQQASGKLKKEGTNYNCSIAYDFSGDCVLKWTAENAQGNEFQLTERVTLTGSSEFRLGSSIPVKITKGSRPSL